MKALWILGCGYLVGCSESDIRTGEISVRLSVVVAGVAVLFRSLIGEWTVSEFLADCLPGVIAILCALISQQRVGVGDGIMIFVLGLVVGVPYIIEVVWNALIVGSIYGGSMLLLHKKQRNESIPFAPCILLGYLLQSVKGYMG